MKDLPKFKAGDRVWHFPTNKWFTLESNLQPTNFPLLIIDNGRGYTFTIDGKNHITDVNPVIFYKEQTLNFEKPKWIPKEGELCYFWNDTQKSAADVRKFKAYYRKIDSPYMTHSGVCYKYCCPITEIPPHLL